MLQQCELDLLAIDRGAIIAPAGCGKTHLIAEALTRHQQSKPILVLTHTNAGVAALRSRLNRADVAHSSYSLATIDGWAMRLVSTFPKRSKLDENVLKLENRQTDYPAIRIAAMRILEGQHVSEILKASYARLIVDEYQDCSIPQHTIICELAKILPTCILGDPLQAIFDFNGNPLVNWKNEVNKHFPVAGALDTPWRWNNVGAHGLGHWLLNVRSMLLKRTPIDLQTAPKEVKWIKLDGTPSDFQKALVAARTRPLTQNGSVLIIGNSKIAESRHQVASAVHGAVVIENVDLGDLITFSKRFNLADEGAINTLIDFAQKTMCNVPSDLGKRVASILAKRAIKPPSEAEQSAISFIKTPSYKAASQFLVEIENEQGVRVYRPTIVKACHRAMHLCSTNTSISFQEAAIKIREQNRALGRPIPKRAVGSTLLVKGLEAESAVILDAESLNTKNLYVALTRGSMSLTICSSKHHLHPG